MSYPNLTAESTPVLIGLATSLPATAVENQEIQLTSTALYEVDLNGFPTTVPLGQSGPFILLIDSEQILCSSFAEGVAEVYQYEGTNGRGWNSSAIAAHNAGVSPVSLTYTSVQAVFATTSATQTLTNKRITRRIDEITTNVAAPVYDTDNYDAIILTGQTTAITSMTSGATGTPNDGDLLQIAITGSATTISWGANFEASTVALPTVTTLTARQDSFFVWNAATSKWRIYLTA